MLNFFSPILRNILLKYFLHCELLGLTTRCILKLLYLCYFKSLVTAIMNYFNRVVEISLLIALFIAFVVHGGEENERANKKKQEEALNNAKHSADLTRDNPRSSSHITSNDINSFEISKVHNKSIDLVSNKSPRSDGLKASNLSDYKPTNSTDIPSFNDCFSDDLIYNNYISNGGFESLYDYLSFDNTYLLSKLLDYLVRILYSFGVYSLPFYISYIFFFFLLMLLFFRNFNFLKIDVDVLTMLFCVSSANLLFFLKLRLVVLLVMLFLIYTITFTLLLIKYYSRKHVAGTTALRGFKYSTKEIVLIWLIMLYSISLSSLLIYILLWC